MPRRGPIGGLCITPERLHFDIVGFWRKHFTRRPARPHRTKKQPEVKVGVQVISPDGMRDE